MTATIRKSGTFAAFSFNVAIDPHQNVFAAALASRRFRHIDLASTEETSAGWVTANDPSGDSFDAGDMDAGAATWLRVRIDQKKLPAERVKQRMAEWRRANGKAPTARQRREIKQELADEILPKLLPTTKNIDALLYAERRIVLVFAAGKSARETFGKLWFESFGVPLDALGPLQLGLRQLVDDAKCDALDRLEPTKWPVARRAS